MCQDHTYIHTACGLLNRENITKENVWQQPPLNPNTAGTEGKKNFVSLQTTEYMYGHTHSKSMGQPGKVANSASGQLNKENGNFSVRVRA